MYKSKYKKASSKIAKRNKTRRYAGLFLKISVPVIFIVGIVFLLRSNFLQVKSFEVLGANSISQESIKNTASAFISGNKLLFIPRSDILFLNKDKLATALLSNFTRIEKVTVNKNFFSKNITLSLTERQADFLWCSPTGECFNMTKDGLVFEKSNFAEASSDKISFRGSLEGNPLMKNFATPAEMQNYLKLLKFFKDAGFEISSVNIESADKAVARSNVGDIIFNPGEADLSIPAQNAILLINETRNKNPSALFNYIDARFGNKMFYKLL
ncbi:MAG: hypothetical protein V1896_01340 [Candidatus Zambryskibacteria bacterium]